MESEATWRQDKINGRICKIIGNVQAVIEGIENGVFSKKANLTLLKRSVDLLSELYENVNDGKRLQK